jgi:CheY-like chemotaxis protein
MRQKKRVLIVDDDADFVAAMSLVLESAGYEALSAGSGAEALDVAERNAPGVVIIDVIMEKPDAGFILARKLRLNSRTKAIRLIILSSINEINKQKGLRFIYSDEDRDEQWLPVDRVLEKPIKPEKLISIVEELMKCELPEGNAGQT